MAPNSGYRAPVSSPSTERSSLSDSSDDVPLAPIALCGKSFTLPGMLSSTEELFEMIRKKTQMRNDCIKGRRFLDSCVQPEGVSLTSTYLLKTRFHNLFTEDEAESYDCHFFKVTPKLARVLNCRQLAVLHSVWEAIEDAGLTAQDLYRTRTGVWVASFVWQHPLSEAPDECDLRGGLLSSMSDHVAFFLGTHGPSVTLDTACSSFMVALAGAVSSLRQGDCDYAIVAGCNLHEARDFTLSLQACGVLSATGTSHPFNEGGPSGYVRADGYGAVIIRRMTDAEADGNRIQANILNVVAGAAGAADGATEGPGRQYEAPCGFGMRELMKKTYEGVKLSPEAITYFEHHATGTLVGDYIELDAVGQVVGKARPADAEPLRCASVKSNIGHGETAAGLFSMIKVLAMFEKRLFLPTAGVTQPRKDFDWSGNRMRLVQDLEPFPPLETHGPIIVGVNSFGVGGSLAHCVMQEYVPPPPRPRPPVPVTSGGLLSVPLLFPLSSVSDQHIQLYAKNLYDHLKSSLYVDLRDVCGTMACNRSQLRYRACLPVRSVDELLDGLEKLADGTKKAVAGEGAQRVLFVFTGQGAQWKGVGDSLMSFPVYSKACKEVDDLFKALSGWSILETAASLSTEELRETKYAQPLTFMVQVGLVAFFEACNIKPTMVLGHSAGEVASAYASGLLSLQEAVSVLYYRTLEQQKLAGTGRMLAVALSHTALAPLIANRPSVEIACYNSPTSTVLAGSAEDLAAVKELLPPETPSTLIPGNIAFHSSLMDPALLAIEKKLAYLNQTPRTAWKAAFVSTVTGQQVVEGMTAQYWVDNVRQPVRLQSAIEFLFADDDTAPDMVIEIGPHRTLLGPIKQTLTKMNKAETVLHSTLRRNEVCAGELSKLLATLFDTGMRVSLKPLYSAPQHAHRLMTSLPLHPFIRKHTQPLKSAEQAFRVSGIFTEGPVVGSRRQTDDSFWVEVSERTMKWVCDHCMGSQRILPGTFYVESVLEAVKLPAIITNIDFKTMCRTPIGNETPLHLCLQLDPVEGIDNAKAFKILSTPGKVPYSGTAEEVINLKYTEHCSGMVFKGDINSMGEFKQGSQGFFTKMELNDIGKDGLDALIKRHGVVLAGSKDVFYGMLNIDQVCEYGPHFQVVQEVRHDCIKDTYLCRLEYDQEAWYKLNGQFGVPLLDGLFQLLIALPSQLTLAVGYASGFEAGYFLKRPCPGPLYAWLDYRPNQPHNGRKKVAGDYLVYDSEGSLVIAIKGILDVIGNTLDTLALSQSEWQPFALPPSADLSGAPVDCTDVAEAVLDAARSLRKASTGRAVFRLLEVVESAAVPTVVEALAKLPLSEEDSQDLIIEAFVGTYSGPILPMLLRSAISNAALPPWLRVRKITVPSLPRMCSDLAFNALIFNDWSSSVSRVYAPQDASDGVTAASTALAQLGPMLAPKCMVVVMGASAESADGEEKTPDFPSRDSEQQARAAEDVKSKPIDSKEWEVALGPNTTAAIQLSGPNDRLVTMVGRYTPPMPAQQRTILVVGKDADLTARLVKQIKDISGNRSTFAVAFDHLDGSNSQEEWDAALKQAVAASKAEERPIQAIAILGYDMPMSDEDPDSQLRPMAPKSFDRLFMLLRAITNVSDELAAIQQANSNVRIWMVTEGVFGGKIRAEQGLLQGSFLGATAELFSEAKAVSHMVDLAGGLDPSEYLAHLADILTGPPREMYYRIMGAATGLEVMRVIALPDVMAARSEMVPADSPITYVTDVTTRMATPGQINIETKQVKLPKPGPGQVIVDIHCAALNFRDVMLSISLLPELSCEGSYYGRHMGMESAGIVSAVGEGVTDLKVGDAVAASEPSCFGNRILAPASRLVPIPRDMNMAIAASVQSVYTTAWHSLVNQARIKPGESVLIHAAAGGVGHAAISVCKLMGVKIYATTSAAKQETVRRLGVENIYDSRSTSWFTDVMRDTDGRGVDVVLNSLAGVHQRLGLQALASGGRFLEIGKMDIYDNAKLCLMALRKNASFFAIDMDRLAQDSPETTASVTQEVFTRLADGKLAPLPVTVFPMDQMARAIEVMKTGKHIGKVVLSNYPIDPASGERRTVVMRAIKQQNIFHPDATYVITGGAGGFGAKLVRDAYNKGARHFVLTVTSKPERARALFHDIMDSPDSSMAVVVADVAKADDVARVLDVARKQPKPFRSIIHVAGVSMETLVPDVRSSKLEEACGAKALGTWHLHEQTLNDDLEDFIVVSSIITKSGGRGNVLYCAANTCADTIVRVRRNLGLPAHAFDMTSISDVGIVATNTPVRRIQQLQGIEFAHSLRCVTDLEHSVMCDLEGGVQMYFREANFSLYSWPNRACFMHGVKDVMTIGDQDTSKLVLTPREIGLMILDIVRAVGGMEDISTNALMSNVGLDSFSTVELASRIRQQLSVDVDFGRLSPTSTVGDLIRVITQAATQANSHEEGNEVREVQQASWSSQDTGPAQATAGTGGPARLSIVLPPKPETAARSPAVPTSSKAVARPDSEASRASTLPLSLSGFGMASTASEETKEPEPVVSRGASRAAKKVLEGADDKPTTSIGCFGTPRKSSKPLPSVDDIEMTTAEARKWLLPSRFMLRPKARLIAFPWAGGSSLVYARWEIPDVEIVMVMLPGRDSRMKEEPIRDFREAASRLVRAIEVMGYLSTTAPPVSFFGHCLGSYLALETAMQLKASRGFPLDRLVICSAIAPHHNRYMSWAYKLPIIQPLLTYLLLGSVGGLPDEIAKLTRENAKAMWRTTIDLRTSHGYLGRQDHYLDCPMVVMYGTKDRLTPSWHALSWGKYTSKGVSLKLLKGAGHLVPVQEEHLPEVQRYLREVLIRQVRAGAE